MILSKKKSVLELFLLRLQRIIIQKTKSMQSPQEIWTEIQELKKEMKGIKRDYADALSNANEYEETAEEMKKLREKKKQIETVTQQRMGNQWTRLEDLKTRSEELSQMLTDIAMTTIMEGKTLEIKDQYDNAYEPVYKINFRKIS